LKVNTIKSIHALAFVSIFGNEPNPNPLPFARFGEAVYELIAEYSITEDCKDILKQKPYEHFLKLISSMIPAASQSSPQNAKVSSTKSSSSPSALLTSNQGIEYVAEYIARKVTLTLQHELFEIANQVNQTLTETQSSKSFDVLINVMTGQREEQCILWSSRWIEH
jgi:hypothetical protein